MATSVPVYTTGFTASLDGVSNAGVFIPMFPGAKIEDGASLSVKSYNITANTANSNENTVLSNIQILEYEEVSRVDYNKPAPPPCIEGYDVVFTHSKTETGGTIDIICSTITTQEEFEAAKELEGGLKVYSYGVDESFDGVYYNDYVRVVHKGFFSERTLMDKKPIAASPSSYIYVFSLWFENGALTGEWKWVSPA
jgi:hypothetical protein